LIRPALAKWGLKKLKNIEKVIEGELLQMGKTRRLNLDEAVYYDMIKGNTATLLAACCAAGAASTFR
jgi:octaprenyl-diphosphate synthase